ncbi:MAG: hypothetical protein Q9198_006592 [Flavoplaca austrocitrina]
MERTHSDSHLAAQQSSVANNNATAMEQPPVKKGIRFWAIILALAVTGLLTALEATITSTALPTIIEALGGASLYVWVINLYFLTMTAFQPLFGQLANVFGRRYPLIFATAIFTFGSGICGGANNIAMMIAGRALQGIGGMWLLWLSGGRGTVLMLG